MTKFTQCAWNAFSTTTQRAVRSNLVSRHCRSPHLMTRLMYSSLHEASFITVLDDGNDASQYGYRIFIPSSPKRTNVGGVVTSSKIVRKSSSSAQQSQSFHYHNNNDNDNSNHRYNDYDDTRMMANDDYSKCMQSIDPSTLDILTSPEVMAILESQCDWEKYKNTVFSSDDSYVSHCEQTPPVMTVESSFDTIPSIDEKKM